MKMFRELIIGKFFFNIWIEKSERTKGHLTGLLNLSYNEYGFGTLFHKTFFKDITFYLGHDKNNVQRDVLVIDEEGIRLEMPV